MEDRPQQNFNLLSSEVAKFDQILIQWKSLQLLKKCLSFETLCSLSVSWMIFNTVSFLNVYLVPQSYSNVFFRHLKLHNIMKCSAWPESNMDFLLYCTLYPNLLAHSRKNHLLLVQRYVDTKEIYPINIKFILQINFSTFFTVATSGSCDRVSLGSYLIPDFLFSPLE